MFDARNMIEGNANINFVYAAPNGDLKVRLNEADKDGRYVFNFHSSDDLAEIIRGLDFRIYDCDDDEL